MTAEPLWLPVSRPATCSGRRRWCRLFQQTAAADRRSHCVASSDLQGSECGHATVKIHTIEMYQPCRSAGEYKQGKYHQLVIATKSNSIYPTCLTRASNTANVREREPVSTSRTHCLAIVCDASYTPRLLPASFSWFRRRRCFSAASWSRSGACAEPDAELASCRCRRCGLDRCSEKALAVGAPHEHRRSTS